MFVATGFRLGIAGSREELMLKMGFSKEEIAQDAARQRWLGGIEVQPMIARRALPIARLIDRHDRKLLTRWTNEGRFHARLSISQNPCRFIDQQLTGQLAEKTNDHDDVKDAGSRLRARDAGRLPRHPAEHQRCDKA